MISLTPEQSQHYASIRWLVRNTRGAGKSFLLAYAVLEEAIASKDWINVIDHWPSMQSREHTMHMVQRIYGQEYSKDYKIEIGELSIRMTRKPTFLPEKPSVLRDPEKP